MSILVQWKFHHHVMLPNHKMKLCYSQHIAINLMREKLLFCISKRCEKQASMDPNINRRPISAARCFCIPRVIPKFGHISLMCLRFRVYGDGFNERLHHVWWERIKSPGGLELTFSKIIETGSNPLKIVGVHHRTAELGSSHKCLSRHVDWSQAEFHEKTDHREKKKLSVERQDLMISSPLCCSLGLANKAVNIYGLSQLMWVTLLGRLFFIVIVRGFSRSQK